MCSIGWFWELYNHHPKQTACLNSKFKDAEACYKKALATEKGDRDIEVVCGVWFSDLCKFFKCWNTKFCNLLIIWVIQVGKISCILLYWFVLCCLCDLVPLTVYHKKKYEDLYHGVRPILRVWQLFYILNLNVWSAND